MESSYPLDTLSKEDESQVDLLKSMQEGNS